MNKWHSLSFYYHITICQTSLLGSLIWPVLLPQTIFHDVSHSFFSSYNREKFLKILDIFLQTKDSDNANSISVAEWQKYLELLLPTLDGFMNI